MRTHTERPRVEAPVIPDEFEQMKHSIEDARRQIATGEHDAAYFMPLLGEIDRLGNEACTRGDSATDKKYTALSTELMRAMGAISETVH